MSAWPCIHGDLCRAYMKRHGIGIIYSKRCPDCEFYDPKPSDLDVEIKPSDIHINVSIDPRDFKFPNGFIIRGCERR